MKPSTVKVGAFLLSIGVEVCHVVQCSGDLVHRSKQACHNNVSDSVNPTRER